jgi:hypothetical protein
MTVPQILGVADGVLVAAVIALGQAVPAWQPYTSVAAQVLGALGTIFGTSHVLSAKRDSK